MASEVVVIPLERYNQLLENEIRVNIMVAEASNCGYFSVEDMMRYLSTPASIEYLERIKQEREERKKANEQD